MLRKIILTCVMSLILQSAMAKPVTVVKSQQADFVVEQVANSLGVPWGLAFISATEMLITEREGKLRLLNLESGKIKNIAGLPAVKVIGQGGLMDVAVPPDYDKNTRGRDWVYFTYVKDVDDQGVTVLARAQLSGLQLKNWTDLLVTNSATDTGYHFGSRIAFDEIAGEKGHVFFGVGDRGERENGQDLTNHASTVMRLYRNGQVPPNNPYIKDNPYIKNKAGLPEVWSYGHRNPQGMAFDYKTKRLWEIEHGPRGGDEINLVLPGRNYGWPVISYGKEYWGPVAVGEGTHKEGMEQPVKQYTPSIAPGSLLLYSGKAFPAWQGNLFAGALKLRHINRVVLDKDANAVAEERLLESLDERIRVLVQSPQGWLYFSTDSGKIFRIKPE